MRLSVVPLVRVNQVPENESGAGDDGEDGGGAAAGSGKGAELLVRLIATKLPMRTKARAAAARPQARRGMRWGRRKTERCFGSAEGGGG